MVSNVFYFHPYLGKIPIFTNIFQMGWTTNQFCFYWFKTQSLLSQAYPPRNESISHPTSGTFESWFVPVLPVWWDMDLFPGGLVFAYNVFDLIFLTSHPPNEQWKKTGCLEYNVGIILPKYTRDCFITIIYITWLNKQYFMFKSPAKLFSWLKWKVGGFY